MRETREEGLRANTAREGFVRLGKAIIESVREKRVCEASVTIPFSFFLFFNLFLNRISF